MGRIQVIDNTSDAMLSSGMLGTSVSNSILSTLQTNFRKLGNVNTIFQKEKELFTKRFIQPIRKAIAKVKHITKDYKHNDAFRPIVKKEQLGYIPPCMHESILTYKPIYDLLKEDRIFGFGYDFKNIREDDPYARMISNGMCKDADEKILNNKGVNCENIWKDDDPELTFDEIDYIEYTRDYIDELLKNSKIDPTDYPHNRG